MIALTALALLGLFFFLAVIGGAFIGIIFNDDIWDIEEDVIFEDKDNEDNKKTKCS